MASGYLPGAINLLRKWSKPWSTNRYSDELSTNILLGCFIHRSTPSTRPPRHDCGHCSSVEPSPIDRLPSTVQWYLPALPAVRLSDHTFQWRCDCWKSLEHGCGRSAGQGYLSCLSGDRPHRLLWTIWLGILVYGPGWRWARYDSDVHSQLKYSLRIIPKPSLRWHHP